MLTLSYPISTDVALLFLEYGGLLVAAAGSIWGTLHEPKTKDAWGVEHLSRAGLTLIGITLLGLGVSVTSSLVAKQRAAEERASEELAAVTRHQQLIQRALANLEETTTINRNQNGAEQRAIQRDLKLTKEMVITEQNRAAAERERQVKSDLATQHILGQINRTLHPFVGKPRVNVEFHIDEANSYVAPFVQRLAQSKDSNYADEIFGDRVPAFGRPAEAKLAHLLRYTAVDVYVYRAGSSLQLSKFWKFEADLHLLLMDALPSLKMSFRQSVDALRGCAGGEQPCSIVNHDARYNVISAMAVNLTPDICESPRKTFASIVDLAGATVIVGIGNGDDIPVTLKSLEFTTTSGDHLRLSQFAPLPGDGFASYSVAQVPSNWLP